MIGMSEAINRWMLVHPNIDSNDSGSTPQEIAFLERKFGRELLPDHKAYLRVFGNYHGPSVEGLMMSTRSIIDALDVTVGFIPSELYLVGVAYDEPYKDLYVFRHKKKHTLLVLLDSCIGGSFDELNISGGTILSDSFANLLTTNAARIQLADERYRALLQYNLAAYNSKSDLLNLLKQVTSVFSTEDKGETIVRSIKHFYYSSSDISALVDFTGVPFIQIGGKDKRKVLSLCMYIEEHLPFALAKIPKIPIEVEEDRAGATFIPNVEGRPLNLDLLPPHP